MAKKASKQTALNIKGLLFRNPNFLIQGLSSSAQGIEVTKVIQTFVMENNLLKVVVTKDNKNQFSGEVKWIGNRDDGLQGSVICVASGNNLQMLIPSEDTVQDAVFEPEKFTIKIASIERTRCSVCGKGLRIFDQIVACPLCGSKGHTDHLTEWIKMRHSCPICKKELDLDSQNNPIPKN